MSEAGCTQAECLLSLTPVQGPVDGGSADGKDFGQVVDRVGAAAVHAAKFSLLLSRQFWCAAFEFALGLRLLRV